MGKNKNGGFQNYAAKKFAQIDRVDQYSEEEIYKILREDLTTILGQINAAKKGGTYPEYAANMFANLSAAKYVYEFVYLWQKDIKKHGDSDKMNIEEAKALKRLISEAFARKDKFVNFKLDEKDRNKYLLEAYAYLDPKGVRHASKLGLSRKQTIELALRIARPMKYDIDHVVRLFDTSTKSNKKKLKVLKKLADGKKKFTEIIGATLTVTRTSSDFVGMAYKIVMPNKETGKKLSKKIRKRRTPFIREYATIYKKRKSFNPYLTDDFYKINKKIIKKLIKEDVGFKKAFAVLKRKNKKIVNLSNDFKNNKSKKDNSKKNKAGDYKMTETKIKRKPVSENLDLKKFLDSDEVKSIT
nr:MAG TPA: hypothetical protein [Caudoviricetes sp.]